VGSGVVDGENPLRYRDQRRMGTLIRHAVDPLVSPGTPAAMIITPAPQSLSGRPPTAMILIHPLRPASVQKNTFLHARRHSGRVPCARCRPRRCSHPRADRARRWRPAFRPCRCRREVRQELTLSYAAEIESGNLNIDDESKEVAWVPLSSAIELPLADSQRQRLKDVIEYPKERKTFLR
jgi:hypothetical protein